MSNLIEKLSKLSLPVVILIASITLGGFYYASQVNKQKSIERQQILKQMEDRRIEDVRTEKEKADETFANNLKCQALLKDLKQRWSNVVGIYYQGKTDFGFRENTCIVKYTKNGEVLEGAIEDMQDIK